jgi:hypothetical protein
MVGPCLGDKPLAGRDELAFDLARISENTTLSP